MQGLDFGSSIGFKGVTIWPGWVLYHVGVVPDAVGLEHDEIGPGDDGNFRGSNYHALDTGNFDC